MNAKRWSGRPVMLPGEVQMRTPSCIATHLNVGDTQAGSPHPLRCGANLILFSWRRLVLLSGM